MANSERNPYVDTNLMTIQQQFCPSENQQFEDKHNASKHIAVVTDENAEADRTLRGNEDNTSKLVSKYVRDEEDGLKIVLPACISALVFEFSYEATNIIFDACDPRIANYVTVSENGKMANISSRTVFLFSKTGYDSGHHIWHIKCHQVYNCQALGITQYKNSKYRFGDNIFDVALNEQLGDRYIYAGDNGHSWRGSHELRPYVCSVINDEEYYSKRLKLKNSRWQIGDIITVNVYLGSHRKDDDTKRTITFLKNGKELCEPIQIVKKCVYYPVFQVYQRGMFQVIDDISKEAIYQTQ